MSDQPNRRSFLKATLAAVASLFLPRLLTARGNPDSFWFLHTPTGDSWAVVDPVAWFLENARQPLLERASEGLRKLTPNDGDRIIRLVTRRCRLNLLELHPERVVVHYWGQLGQGDLRSFFKAHGLARKRVRVVLIDRKREVTTLQQGDDFLFGERLPAFSPWKTFLRKWHRRDVHEVNDSSAAPGTRSGYAWEGVESNRIPWAALKSAWRRTSFSCLNCDQPTILVNFGFPWCGMFNRCPRFIHVCGECRRSFEDGSVKDVGEWIVANLDADVWPDYDMMWDRRVKWKGKIKPVV